MFTGYAERIEQYAHAREAVGWGCPKPVAGALKIFGGSSGGMFVFGNQENTRPVACYSSRTSAPIARFIAR
jgi:hypothetical protein